ncbi:MAG: MATE family efflux transporter [Prevotellaceae bacterium]|nr:MATE family efflux transporter [Prevotellaceae bacterium]
MATQRIPTALGTENIGKLLMQYAIPAIIAMTASSLYNMVDSIFIGQGVGALAISGLALTFPLMNLAAAFGSLVGVGASTLVSVKLGQRDYDTAQRVLGNVVMLNVILGLLITFIVYPCLNPILRFFGGSDDTMGYARDYMSIIMIGNVVTHLYFGLNSQLRASGHPKTAMYATVGTVCLNAILDPLFIFGLGWGIRGAAVATVLSQVCALCFQIRIFSNPNELLHFKRSIFHLKWKIVLASLSIGLSPFLMNLASCFIVTLTNQGLKKYGGDLAIGAFGIVNRLLFLMVMVVIGLNQGMQPIAGYNYGARLYGRVTGVLKKTILYATCVTTVGSIIGFTIPEVVVRIFTHDAELISIASKGLRIVLLVFPFVGFQMVTSIFFQSIGMASKAIFLSLTRQLVVLLPCLLILPRFFGTAGVWFSMPTADLIAVIISAVMLVAQFRSFKRDGARELL